MKDFITWFDQEFKRLEAEWRDSIERLDPASLYFDDQQQLAPAAEQILRSARIVEQVSGGITANLWDDPFEWTLPETLRTKDKLIAYIDEVHDARARAFQLFKDDADLLKTVMAASGLTQLLSLWLDALVRARYHQLQAREDYRTPRRDN
jgi:hypothetical protein